jgi:hypothetical protein
VTFQFFGILHYCRYFQGQLVYIAKTNPPILRKRSSRFAWKGCAKNGSGAGLLHRQHPGHL